MLFKNHNKSVKIFSKLKTWISLIIKNYGKDNSYCTNGFYC